MAHTLFRHSYVLCVDVMVDCIIIQADRFVLYNICECEMW